MPIATIGGIKTHYEVKGDGTPLLMLAPGGFDSSISRWRVSGVWKDLQPLDTLAREARLIAYDRREAGDSGGRIEPFNWSVYVRHAIALLDHLGIRDACMLGGCMGCSVALAIAAQCPERCRGLLLHWPVGGFRWMNKGRTNFNRHIDYAREHGLRGVAARAAQSKLFWGDPEAGPWASVIAADEAFAAAYADQDLGRYLAMICQSRDNLFNDVMPSGASGDEMTAMKTPVFIMAGDDPSHSASSAHALRELIPGAKLSPLMPPQQNAQTVARWVRDGLAAGTATLAEAGAITA
jgi:pimeloyl-ACP methyl ester carboxylesterase